MNKATRNSLITGLVFSASLLSTVTQAAEYTLSIKNLTRGIYFTPLLVSAHDPANTLFVTGQPASANLQAMAEGGDIAGLVTDLTAVGATILENPAGGLLAPGASVMTTLDTGSNTQNSVLSLVAMMLPTNDGFVGLNSYQLPTKVGTSVTVHLSAYDAGTEANDEVRGGGAPGTAGFPVPPPLDAMIGMNGTGVSADVEGFIHVHRNVIGDDSATDGLSDIDNTVHRWLNPVASVTIELISQ